jgi:hypothetical protein
MGRTGHEQAVSIHADHDCGDLEERVPLGVEARGLDINDDRQKAAEA